MCSVLSESVNLYDRGCVILVTWVYSGGVCCAPCAMPPVRVCVCVLVCILVGCACVRACVVLLDSVGFVWQVGECVCACSVLLESVGFV